ncbi:MAG: Gfo/Idh/MocA family protein [Pirellulales bacterium]
MRQRIHRRGFLGCAAAGAAGWTILRNSRSARAYAANEKVNLGMVGVAGRGRELLGDFSQSANVVAMCDVNDQRAANSFKLVPAAKTFRDFRKMLDAMGRQIDAVVVATPDHTHAVATAAAIRAGKHVYTEKPLTRTVQESRKLRALANQFKVATSMGNQGTASDPFRRALELIRDGVIGPVKEVHTWNDQGGAGEEKYPEGEAKVPAYLDWDLWLGPARFRPFHPRWMAWHSWREFGTANLGNWASHTQNLAFMALAVDSLWHAEPAAKPVLRIEAKVQKINRISFPRWELVRWDVPARGKLPPVSFWWHNGSSGPGIRDQVETLLGRGLDWGDKGAKTWADWAGCLIVGTEGKIYATGHNATYVMLPEEKFKPVQKDRPEKVDRSRGHSQDWLSACRGGKAPWANFDYAGPLTEFNMLGNVATQFEGVLEYDPLAGKILNNAEADKALDSEYRQGWTL